MHDRETVEMALYALSEGANYTEAAEFAGASRDAVRRWALAGPPHERRGRRGASCAIPPAAKAPRPPAPMSPPDAEEEPSDEAERAAYEAAMTENMLLRAVLDDLKGEGSHPVSMSNRRKCELGERLRLATGLPLREVTAFLRISKSSYEYHRARLGRDKYARLREEVREVFEEGGRVWGYRTVRARLGRRGVRVSEKVVRRIMREEGLRPACAGRRRRGWSSYGGEVSEAPENLVGRDFRAGAPDELWLTDIAEFRLPCGSKVYLSPVIDCFDGMPVAWSIGERPTGRLARESLLAAVARMRPGAAPVVHSDRGVHYRTGEWASICEENGLTRSMSAKGCSPDNAACEGFFGRLKNEFFHYRDWRGVAAGEFMDRLDAYMRYYCEGRIKRSLGWLSPAEYRSAHGYGA